MACSGVSTNAAAGRDESQVYGEGRRRADALGAQAAAVRKGAGGTSTISTRTGTGGTEAGVDGELRVDVLGRERGGAADTGADEPDPGAGERRGGADTKLMGRPTRGIPDVAGDLWVGILAGHGRGVLNKFRDMVLLQRLYVLLWPVSAV